MTLQVRSKRLPHENNPAFKAGITIVLTLVGLALIGPLFLHSYAYDTGSDVLANPSLLHPLGTDSVGRDIFARVAIGLRSSLFIVIVSATISLTIGTLLGLFAAYFGGSVDWAFMRLVDVLLAVPTLLVAVAVLAALGPSAFALIAVLGVTFIPHTTRVIRSSALRISNQEFVVSARISGVPWYKIVIKHVLPNARGILFVQSAVTIANMLVVETALSFLGLGVPPPTPSVGYIIAEGRQWMEVAPWPVISGSLVIILLILGVTLIGQGLDRKLSLK